MTSTVRPGKLITVIETGGMLGDLVMRLRELQAEHPEHELRISNGMSGFDVRVAGDPCGCHTCLNEDREVRSAANPEGGFLFNLGFAGMVLCPVCGNKRCPKANHHDNPCHASNEAGQPGSAYPAP